MFVTGVTGWVGSAVAQMARSAGAVVVGAISPARASGKTVVRVATA